ncbi:MAG: type effector Hrp-dependent outer domain protein [Tardiphaga sp.]|nr:type effector Hrp-dependent outer domain protein [Tardiphaga sp.]
MAMQPAMPADSWPDGPLLAYVGDDFTGSTDVLEAFTTAGISTVLFLKPPDEPWVKRFAGMRCVGLATNARSQSPQWMDTHLAAAFARMRAFGAPLLQYKICSTFDSSPDTGSIGRAIDLGCNQMPGAWSPTIVGVPRLKRYQAFGNLFAAIDGVAHRLDRHPTMSRHPVTPMDEADLRVHLALQTPRRIELIDLVQLQTGQASARREALTGRDTPVVLFDVIDDATLAEAGRIVWQGRGNGLFSASSSGLQYALAAHWRNVGLLSPRVALRRAAPVDVIAVISGSCSPITAAQIGHARDNGFVALRLDIPRVLDGGSRAHELARITALACDACSQGLSPLVYSAEGPDDPAVCGFGVVAAKAGLSRPDASLQIGTALAEIMRQLLDSVPGLRRVVVAGGDSAGAVASRLDIAALTIDAELAPGAPLCRVWSDNPRRDQLQIVLKGGQMGALDFFRSVRAGRE